MYVVGWLGVCTFLVYLDHVSVQDWDFGSGRKRKKEGRKRKYGLFSRSRFESHISGRVGSRKERNGDHEGVKTVYTAEMLECLVIGVEL